MAQMACPQCGAVFDNKDELKEHRKECSGEYNHPEGDYKYKCGICGRRFNSELALGAHRIKHSADDE